MFMGGAKASEIRVTFSRAKFRETKGELPTKICKTGKLALPIGPAALLVLLTAAARAGRIRLGLLEPYLPGQCLVRVAPDDLVDSLQA